MGGGTGQAAAPQRTRARAREGRREGAAAAAARRAHKGGGRGSALTGRAGAVHARGRAAGAGEAALRGRVCAPGPRDCVPRSGSCPPGPRSALRSRGLRFGARVSGRGPALGGCRRVAPSPAHSSLDPPLRDRAPACSAGSARLRSRTTRSDRARWGSGLGSARPSRRGGALHAHLAADARKPPAGRPLHGSPPRSAPSRRSSGSRGTKTGSRPTVHGQNSQAGQGAELEYPQALIPNPFQRKIGIPSLSPCQQI